MFNLTFDIDWAADELIADTLDIVRSYGVAATWFVTHATPLLADIAAAPGQELGIHPNFDPLFAQRGAISARDTIAALMEVVPNSVSVRSHALVRSSRLAALFFEAGLSHESNYLLPTTLPFDIPPWRDYSGLVQVPIRWEDDVFLLDRTFEEPERYIGSIKHFTVNFHPVQVFLNTVTFADYERARAHVRDATTLADMRRAPGAGGTRDRLLRLLAAVRESGMPTGTISGCRAMDPANG